MYKFDRILFATDFSGFANNAFPFAVRFAQMYGAKLYLLHIIVSKDDENNKGLDKETIEQIKESVSQNFKELIKKSTTNKTQFIVKTLVATSSAEGILNFINENEIDLAVIGTYGSGWSGPFFLGSVAERVTRHAECPILTVSKKSNEEIYNILVPIDFSDYSKSALKLAKEIAHKYKARLSLLHVIEPNIYPSFYDIQEFDFVKMASLMKAKSPNELKKLLNETPGPKVEADTYFAVGQPAFQILKFTLDYEPDLIVISSHGLTDIDYFLLGSAADKVIKRANCPVLSLKSV
jgi:nucleotide-binding universal stress UspA family protein